MLLPGESLSKYRGAPVAQISEIEETPSVDAGNIDSTESSYRQHEEHQHEHEPTEASAELRERPAIAPFRADLKNTEVADEQQRLHDMNVAAVFGGDLVEEEVIGAPEQAAQQDPEPVVEEPSAPEQHTAPSHDIYVHDNLETESSQQKWSEIPAAKEATETVEEAEARTHQEGNYSPEGAGSVVHEELDEEEADMMSASDHYHMHDLDNDAADRQHDFATRLGDAAGLLGDAVRDTEEERAI